VDESPTGKPTGTRHKAIDEPYAWQSKAALRTIAAACDNRTDKAHVLAVYLALTWKRSDLGNVASFEASKRHIAAVAGVSYRKCAEILSLLKSLGLIAISANAVEGTKEQGPNTYTLCTVSPTPGTVCPRLGTDAGQTTLPRSEEKKVLEESLEQNAPVGAVVGEVPLPSALDTAEFKAAWADYSAYRAERKLPKLIPRSVKAQLAKLAGWGVATAIASIQQTIEQHWTGLFEPKVGYGVSVKPNSRTFEQRPSSTDLENAYANRTS
jgi:hypothetical protein